MAFRFGRKKEEEIDDDILEEEDESGSIKLKTKKIKDRDFKDLKPQPKSAREEVKKPWGKKERMIVLVIFLFTTLTPAFLGLSSRNWKLPGLPRIAVPKVTMPNFYQDKINMEEDSKEVIKTKKAKEVLVNLTSHLTGVYAVSVIRLGHGSTYGINEDTKLTAASLIKLPVITALYIESENGNINLDDKYTLINEDKAGGSGSLARKPAGYQITYRNLAELMGKQSDNTAFRILRKILGDEKINSVIKNGGMASTSLEQNITTATDMSRFLESLWKDNLVNVESKNEILSFLTNTIYESWLPAGLPENVKIAHKYGREVHVVNDAGIVYADDPYVIVVISDGIIDKEADEVIPKISSEIFKIESD